MSGLVASTSRPTRRRQHLLLSVSAGALACSIAPDALAAGPAPFSAAWFAAKGAGSPAASAAIANAAAGAGMTSTSFAQVRQSLANLQHTAAAIAAMRAVQAQAHAVGANLVAVPNGLQAGGIVPDSGLAGPGVANAVTSWTGALAPVQTGPAAAPTVTVRQTAQHAFLNWSRLNVGAQTTLSFDQSAGGAASPTWVALNRVNDPTLSPTQIAGRITAPGHVVIVNNSGIIFTPSAQVTVGSLIASTASISNTQFNAGGIYSPAGTDNPSFTGATAPVIVQGGAQISTTAPLTVTSAGGGVILLGSDVANAGAISTPEGQTVLAAGRDFALQQGYSVTELAGGTSNFGIASTIGGNTYRTTRGTEIAVTAGGGKATNSGLIEADQGDVTLAGETVTQAGVAASTTTTATRGTIHLLTDGGDAKSSVTLAPGSVTTILPDASSGTALDAQRATDVSDSANADLIRAQGTGTTFLNDQPSDVPDNQYQSLIQIVSGNTVDAGAGSLAMSQGGQIQIVAPGRVLIENGAQLDVSGEVGVTLPMSANQVAINVQGFELRDDPLNRDTALLNSSTVYLDTRNLVTVAASSADVDSPYTEAGRLYTEGGLLEVSGEVSNISHTIGEWSSPGGTILISGGKAGQVVAQPGSVFNLAGGSIDYQAGALKLTWLVGPNGVLYNAQTAPADLVYTGVYDGVSETHARWNITQTFNNPLIAPRSENIAGYVQGRDGGTLEISEPTALLEGTVDAGVIDGPDQTAARNEAVTDPYLQAQTAVPLAGQLLIGNYGGLGYGAAGLVGGYDTTVTLQAGGAPAAASLGLATALPAGRLDTAILDTDALTAESLGVLSVTTEGTATVASPLTLATAGQLTLHAAGIVVEASLTAHAGTVSLGDVIPLLDAASGAEPEQSLVPTLTTETGAVIPAANAAVSVATGVTIDLTGRWTNVGLDPVDLTGEAAVNGGSLTIDTTGAITLSPGSIVDASAGAVLSAAGSLASGAGGGVTLIGDDPNGNRTYESTTETATLPVALAGTIRSIGVAGTTCGTLTLRAPAILVQNTATPTGLSGDGRTVLTPSFFDSGFTNYSIDGYGNLATVPSRNVVTPFTAPAVPAVPLPGVEFAAGAAIRPLVPVYLQTSASLLAPTGTAPETAATTYLPPLYVQNQTTATLAQRAGASVELYSRNFNQLAGTASLLLDGGGGVAIGPGASVTVDPAQNVRVEALGQITVAGDITAPGGTIALQNDTYEPGPASGALEYNPDLSIWIASSAVIDANGVADIATDLLGRAYGLAPSGGVISIGGPRTTANGYAESTDAAVVIRPGAVLEASGSNATVDLAAGQGFEAASTATPLSGAGGAIELDSTSAIALDGTVRAAAGGPGAAGGSLEIDLVTPTYSTAGMNGTLVYTVPDALRVQRVITVSQQAMPSALPAGETPDASLAAIFGSANVDADVIATGGFGSLTLAGNSFAGAGPVAVRFAGPVSLATSDSIDLPAQMTETSTNSAVTLAAPYVTLNGNAVANEFLSTASGFTQQIANLQTAGETASSTASASTLAIDAGQLLIQTGTVAGLRVTTALNSTTAPTGIFDQPGFGSAAFFSGGDTQIDGTFEAAGRLSLTAAQLYPLAASTVALGLDQNGNNRNVAQPGTLVIGRTPGTDPMAPLVVGQSLTLAAATIEQGGIVRSPLGQITLGFSTAVPGAPEASVAYADRVEFLPGSVTSVSADSQTILYGGTADGVTYSAGTALTTNDALPTPSITLAAQSVSLDSGATLDLSGGGTLAGSAFNSGRGGSTDVLTAPLLRFSGTTASTPTGDQVYAIVPSFDGTTQPSPVTAVTYTGTVDAAPPAGEQLTLGAGVPGLAAGTYTLQPAYDALLPGAYRVELQPSTVPVTTLAAATGDLSTAIAGTIGTAGTAIRGSTRIGVIVTGGAAVRRLSSYDEESASSFVLAQAALLGTPRGTLPADAGTVFLSYNAPVAAHTLAGASLTVSGLTLLQPAAGGFGGFVDVTGTGSALDIVADGNQAADTVAATVKTGTTATTVVSLRASDLDRLAPETLSIGGTETLPSSQGTADFDQYLFNGSSPSVTVAAGAVLSAPQVFLIGQNAVSVASGASIDTLGKAAPSYDSADGFVYTDFNGATSVPVVAVSNGILNFAAPQLTAAAAGSITIGDGAVLVGAGTVGIDTPGAVSIGNGAVFAARDLSFAVSSVNILPSAGLPAGEADPPGLILSQSVLSSLTAGGIVAGAPALQQIELTATSSVNFFGTVGFDLGGAQTLILDTPSIYGDGNSSDVATVVAGTFFWNGVAAVSNISGSVGIAGNDTGLPTYASEPAAPVATFGPGTGSGGLVIDAADIILGYAPGQQLLTPAATGGAPVLGRNTYGFSSVALNASRSVTANSSGTLAVYQTQGAYAGGGYANTGGALTIDTPLLTASAGAVLQASTGGALALVSPGGTPGAAAGLGGEIDLTGNTVSIADTVALPEGKLSLNAAGDIALAPGALIDLAGTANVFFDQTVPGPGGTLVAESTAGSLTADPASTIDVSSPGASAGSIELTAGAGNVSLAGAIEGGGSGQGGSIGIRAGTLTDFAGLNQRLTAGGLEGGRTFEIAQGDLTIETADQLRAGDVDVTLDSGSLTVDGLVDASGPAPGSISLSAGDNLTLTAGAVLDAHGTAAQIDSLGATIDSENTGAVTLRVADGPDGTNLAATGASGTLTVAAGATIDVSAAPGVTCAAGPCGQVTFDVPRLGSTAGTNGDLAISAAGKVNIAGAGTIAVDGFWSYAPADGLVTQSNTGASADPNGIGLDQIDAADRLFIAGAIPNGALNATLAAKLAGLTAYTSAFHLRPGVEIDSSAASGGNLVVNGDLDLSALRYASLNPSSQLTTTYGSGEPGVLVLRASDNLNIYGSITDGFEQPVDSAANQNPDDNGWILQDSNLTGSNTDQPIVVPPGADPIDIGGSVFNNNAGITTSVNYAVAVAGGQSLASGTVLPTSITLQAPLTLATAVVAEADVIAANGTTVLFGKGSTIPAGSILPQNATLDAGFVLFAATAIAATNTVTGLDQTWPAGTSFAPFGVNGATLAGSVVLQPGDIIPVDTRLTLNTTDFSDQVNLRQPATLPNGLTGQGEIYAATNILPAGSLSWSVALVGGANTASADPTALTPASALVAAGNTGDLTLADLHSSVILAEGSPTYVPTAFSVVRTGTGSLGLFAGGTLDQTSSYGIYTAGAQSPGIVGTAFDQHGTAYATVDPAVSSTAEAAVYDSIDAAYPQGGGNVAIAAQGDLLTTSLPQIGVAFGLTSETGAWLERQGDGSAADPGAWWVNFGNYIPVTTVAATTPPTTDTLPLLTGFAGIGTLGGGNLTVVVGGDAGVASRQAAFPQSVFIADTNGDTLNTLHNSSLDLAVASTGRQTASGATVAGGGILGLQVGNVLDPISNSLGGTTAPISAQSTILSLRGTVSVTAGSVSAVNGQTNLATPLDNPYRASVENGPELILGDSRASVTARGDISLGETGDATREPTLYVSPNGATSWFSLWQPSTAVALYSAGGDISPAILAQPLTYYPPTLDAIAASGSIYTLSTGTSNDVLETAPSATGELQYLAGTSIVSGLGNRAGGITEATIVAMSGADPTMLPTVANPAFTGETGANANDTTEPADTLFAFSTDTPTGYIHAADPNPIRFYAGADIVNLSTGELLTGTTTPVYIAAKPVRIEAGRDIVDLDPATNSGLLWNNTANDVSEISAGNDIFYANADVSGPGLLEVSAGNNIDQTQTNGTSFSLTSLGYLVDKTVATQNSGAGITVSAGATPATLDLSAFAALYFNAANLANPLTPLQDQPGKVERTYQSQLLAFLQQRGYTGDQAGALAAFAALPPDIQQILVLQTYYAELNQSGLDFSNPGSRFFKSYSEGTEAVHTLFPATDLSGQTAATGGSLTLTGGSGITTQFGGSIQILDPAGATTVGVPGVVPPSTAGVVTQGSGDVDIYSYGSVLLGQSRIFTTFGGNITIWLQGNGEINGGQGSMSTIVFTPPVISYDNLGDVSLSPTTPSTGAGIAVLAPVAGIPAGDINLISPFGTIDAGEAGIRSSGNVNLVALTILNAANVQAGGHVSGVPTVAVPDVAAITAASSTAGSASNAAQNNLRPVNAQKTPSIITVDVVGSGAPSGDDNNQRKHKS